MKMQLFFYWGLLGVWPWQDIVIKEKWLEFWVFFPLSDPFWGSKTAF